MHHLFFLTDHGQEKESVDPCLLFDFKAAWIKIVPQRWRRDFQYEVETKDLVEMKVRTNHFLEDLSLFMAQVGTEENSVGYIILYRRVKIRDIFVR